jgi:hypothetical protein
MKFLIFIPTFNRPGMCNNLLWKINELKGNHDIQLLVVNDGSTVPYDDAEEFLYVFKNAHYIRNAENNGKKLFWKTIQLAFDFAKTSQWDYFVMLGDDTDLWDGFFEKAIAAFHSADITCLNLLTDLTRVNTRQWTNIPSISINEYVYRTGWMDLCFMAQRRFFDALNYTIEPVPESWTARPDKSSGVGMQLSKRLITKGLYFHQMKRTLVYHGHHASMMHPEEREKHPLITEQPTDTITASLASVPSRRKTLKQVTDSLLPYIDNLNVYLNNYPDIPEFLKHEKITVFTSQKTGKDLGDVGKFYQCETVQGYHFTCDDDIIYPPDYVPTMIAAIEKYERQCVVSLHGRIYNHFPVESYYRGHRHFFHCMKKVDADVRAHVVGTGVMAYHTDTLKINLEDFREINMSDVWMTVICQSQKVDRMIIAHQAGWLKTTEYDKTQSIFYKEFHNDKKQTQIINSIKWEGIMEIRDRRMQPEVEAKYYCKTITPGVFTFAGFGEIDLRKITLAEADRLVQRGFKFLIPKSIQAQHQKLTKQAERNLEMITREQKEEPPSRSNKFYINKLLTMNWENLNDTEQAFFFRSQTYFLVKKQTYFQIADIDREMKAKHAKMRTLPPDSQHDSQRAELLDKLSDLDSVKAALWAQIDEWTAPKDFEKNNLYEKGKEEAIKADRRLKANSNYIYRALKELQNPDLAPDRKAAIESEIAIRKKEMEELGQPYNRKPRK